MSNNTDSHKIRPAGKHLLTVGRDLIQDKHAAIIELVKNAYDADSSSVDIKFSVFEIPIDESSKDENHENEASKTEKQYAMKIIIKDNGHGMSRDTVIDKWLVPSTDDKLSRKESPNGRKMQGRKGIGRYSASILGSDLLMETITPEGEYTTVFLEWTDFASAKYLDDVEILVETTTTDKTSGTILTITATNDDFEDWDADETDRLEYELKKLISPVEREVNKDLENLDFIINMEYENFWEEKEYNIKKPIKPFPIFDLYDYRISGNITKEGIGKLVFHNQKSLDSEVESLNYFFLPDSTRDDEEREEYYPTMCGDLHFDIRVYDRDKESIEQLIHRGLKDDNGKYVGKLEARRMLNANNGIGVYRNGFRIRPLGDPEFDWLQLNKQRIQNPTQKLGSDQVIGYVLIKSEEESGLEEKSARDGLNNNKSYRNLQEISQQVISLIETRRYSFRKKIGLGRTSLKIEKELEKLFNYDDVKSDIRNTLQKNDVDVQTTDSVITIVENKAKENNQIADNIRNEVVKYQSQATLGKIIDVIKHESGAPLSFFKNNSSLFEKLYVKYQETEDIKYIQKILDKSKGFQINSSLITNLFEKITPLSAADRGIAKPFNLLRTIKEAVNIYSQEAIKNKIEIQIKAYEDLTFIGYETDFYQIIINLVSNSFYWMTRTSKGTRVFTIEVFSEEGVLSHIDIKDTGSGIEKHILDSHALFEPGFSSKIGGTGIGLSIAGEAALRNDLELVAFESKDGAYFRLQMKEV
jgi:signal transduction histidine kinase